MSAFPQRPTNAYSSSQGSSSSVAQDKSYGSASTGSNSSIMSFTPLEASSVSANPQSTMFPANSIPPMFMSLNQRPLPMVHASQFVALNPSEKGGPQLPLPASEPANRLYGPQTTSYFVPLPHQQQQPFPSTEMFLPSASHPRTTPLSFFKGDGMVGPHGVPYPAPLSDPFPPLLWHGHPAGTPAFASVDPLAMGHQLVSPESLNHTMVSRTATVKVPSYIVAAPPAFKRRRYVTETRSRTPYNVHKNLFRKNNDNFVIDSSANTLFAVGPRRTYCKDTGLVQATGDFHHQRIISIGESTQICDDYSAWMQKKIRSRVDPEFHSGVINVIGRADVPDDQHEIDLADLHRLITLAFPHWNVVFDPEFAPILALKRYVEPLEPSSHSDDAGANTNGSNQDVIQKECEKAEPGPPPSQSPKNGSEQRTITKSENIPLEPFFPGNADQDIIASTLTAPKDTSTTSDLPHAISHKEPSGSKLTAKQNDANREASLKQLKRHTPLGIITRWMFVEERKAIHRYALLQKTSSASKPFQSNPLAWLKFRCFLIPSTGASTTPEGFSTHGTSYGLAPCNAALPPFPPHPASTLHGALSSAWPPAVPPSSSFGASASPFVGYNALRDTPTTINPPSYNAI